MGTKIRVLKSPVAVSYSGYITKIKVTTLGVTYGDDYTNILTLNETVMDSFNTELARISASVTQETTTRVSEDGALASLITTVDASYASKDVATNARITHETTARVTSTDALATDITTVEATVNDVHVELTDTKAVVAGQFAEWTGGTPLIGNIKFVGDVQYQYLGGMLGEASDGWVRSDKAASDKADTLAATTGTSILALQNQIDGNIVTWFYDGAPTITGVPASGWSASEKVNHIGDLYYDKVTGYAYRFAYEDIDDDPDQGIIYSWIMISDVDVTKALADAATAQAAADGKVTTYYVGTAPIGASVGDLWIHDITKITKTWDGTAWRDTTNTTTETTKGWVATASSLVVNPATGQVTGWQYGDGSGFSSVFKISADNIIMNGSVHFIQAADVNANVTSISGGVIQAGTSISAPIISGGDITGVNITGSVIKASWIDYSSVAALTNWKSVTNISSVSASYRANFAKHSDTGLYVITQGYYRLPKTMPVVAGVNPGSNGTYSYPIYAFNSYKQSSTDRLMGKTGASNGTTKVIFQDYASHYFVDTAYASVGTIHACHNYGSHPRRTTDITFKFMGDTIRLYSSFEMQGSGVVYNKLLAWVNGTLTINGTFTSSPGTRSYTINTGKVKLLFQGIHGGNSYTCQGGSSSDPTTETGYDHYIKFRLRSSDLIQDINFSHYTERMIRLVSGSGGGYSYNPPVIKEL